eukprot:512832-Prymnesium_polylepis.1
MPLIHERRGHPGTFLGAACPWCAVRRYRALRALCGALCGTRYVSLRGLMGSRPVPSTYELEARRPVRACVATL